MSRRFSLREFQQNILSRIEEREKSATGRASTLGVQVGQGLWLVDMQDISEVLPLPSVTPVPLTQPWYRGVANVRGNLYSISDFASFLGSDETRGDGLARVLLASPKLGCNVGLLVTSVLGLRDSSIWRSEIHDGEEQLFNEQGQMWRKLNLAQLVRQPNFLEVGL
ncbi:MAG: chemotaxis protein CheW [Candidatus Nitrotoga sp.]